MHRIQLLLCARHVQPAILLGCSVALYLGMNEPTLSVRRERVLNESVRKWTLPATVRNRMSISDPIRVISIGSDSGTGKTLISASVLVIMTLSRRERNVSHLGVDEQTWSLYGMVPISHQIRHWPLRIGSATDTRASARGRPWIGGIGNLSWSVAI